MKYLIIFFLQIFLLASAAFGLEADVSYPQGALWNIRESGHPEEARNMESQLRQILTNAPLVAMINQGGGVSTSYVARFERNIFAIVKEADPALPESYKHEVAAYYLDKLLGLHMVPLTVYREVNGKMYSVMLFNPSFSSEAFLDLMESEFFLRRGDVAAFDFLINNIDRNLWEGSNVLLAKEGRMTIFDHARAFFPGEPVTNLGALSEISAELREKILITPESEFVAILDRFITPDGKVGFLERLRYLKHELSRLPAKPAKPVAHKNLPKIPEVFEVPEKLQGHTFHDLLGIGKASRCSGLF